MFPAMGPHDMWSGEGLSWVTQEPRGLRGGTACQPLSLQQSGMLALSHSTLIPACIFPMAFKLITSAIDMLIIRENAAWGLSFWRNSPLLGGVSPKEVMKYVKNKDCSSKIYRSLKTRIKSAGVYWPGTKRLQESELFLGSLLVPDVCDCQSLFAPPLLPSLHIKEAQILS